MKRALDALLTCQSYFSEGRSTVSPHRLVQVAATAAAVGVFAWVANPGERRSVL